MLDCSLCQAELLLFIHPEMSGITLPDCAACFPLSMQSQDAAQSSEAVHCAVSVLEPLAAMTPPRATGFLRWHFYFV